MFDQGIDRVDNKGIKTRVYIVVVHTVCLHSSS